MIQDRRSRIGTGSLSFGSGTSTLFGPIRGTSVDPAHSESRKGSVTATLICHFARTMLSQPVKDRSNWRAHIVTALQKARATERGHCIDQMLHVFVSEGGPDGLDAAIDILAKMGSLVLNYAWEYLLADINRWGPTSERAYDPNDDTWYVLRRAVARAEVPLQDRFRLIGCCTGAQTRGMREAVVEALHDLGKPATERLRKFAKEDPDAFIREIAREALEDLES